MTSQTTENVPNPVDGLFLKFAAAYGYVWRNQFKSDEFIAFAKGEWLNALSVFKATIISEAVDYCCRTKPLPLTLPQFVELCKWFQQRKCVAERTTLRGSREVALHYLQQMKEHLSR